MTENELKSLNELEQVSLFKNPTTDPGTRDILGKILYSKYESMIHKHWWKLQKQMNCSPEVMSIKDEYYGEATEAFFMAIEKVDLNKVYDKNFKLMQMASWYIGNVRIKWIKRLIKESKTTRPLNYLEVQDLTDSLGPDPEAEKSYWTTEGYQTEPSYVYEQKESDQLCSQAVKACLSKWSPVQCQVFGWLKENKTKTEISGLCGLSLAQVGKLVKGMKNDLKKALGLSA